IDPIGAEAAQRGLAGHDQVTTTQTSGVGIVRVLREKRLRREDGALAAAPAPKRFTDDALALAGGISVRRVDEVDPLVQRMLDHRDRVGLARTPAEHHRAEAELTDLDAAAAQTAVFLRLARRLPSFASF